ncbi:MAG: IS4 family transposase [Bradymonadaceae bacterium]
MTVNTINDNLRALIHDVLIIAHARLSGAVERERKVDIVIFVWTLVLGFSAGSKRSLASLRRTYQVAAGHTLGAAAFYERFCPKLCELLKSLMLYLLERRTETFKGPVKTEFQNFRQLLAVDTTIIRLYDMLKGVFPSTQPSQAACKLHVLMNVLDGSPQRVKLSGGTTNDQGPWQKLGSWVNGCLLLFDLGYYNFHLFHRIDRRGGYFITRLKKNANPRIISSLVSCPGNAIDLRGMSLQDVLPKLQRKLLDLTVEVDVKLRVYGGERSTIVRRFRLVAHRHEETGIYHLYLTNVPAETLSAEDIAQTYRLRWQVELLFKAMRTHGRLHHLPSRKEVVVRALVYASIISLMVSRHLLDLVRRTTPNGYIPALRFQEVFATYALELLMDVTSHRRSHDIDVWDLIRRESADPNHERERSFDVLWEDVHDMPRAL